MLPAQTLSAAATPAGCPSGQLELLCLHLPPFASLGRTIAPCDIGVEQKSISGVWLDYSRRALDRDEPRRRLIQRCDCVVAGRGEQPLPRRPNWVRARPEGEKEGAGSLENPEELGPSHWSGTPGSDRRPSDENGESVYTADLMMKNETAALAGGRVADDYGCGGRI